MKKLNSIMYALLAFVMVIGISSCEKESENAQVANGKASLSGKAQINLNIVNDILTPTYDKVPAGTVIYARINSKDLVTNTVSGATYADIVYTTTVDANGNYSFTDIAANLKDVTVTLTSDDFRSDYVESPTSTTSKICSLTAVTKVVRANETRILDVIFSIK